MTELVIGICGGGRRGIRARERRIAGPDFVERLSDVLNRRQTLLGDQVLVFPAGECLVR
jgi:hypothetical protein